MSSSRIHDIKPSHGAHRPSYVSRTKETSVRPPVRPPRRVSREPSRGGRGIWYVAILLIAALFFGLSIFFTGATVQVTPKTLNPTLNERFVAYKKPIAGELTFDFMVVDGEVSETLTSTTKENVQDRARGTVRIFNNHSTSSQLLIIDTRLVDENGRTYKTVERVTVPGQKTVDDVLEPGFIDVEIYADIPGPAGNEIETGIRLGVAGFKEANSPKYETIYAETLTSLEGGFSGERFVIDEDQKRATEERLIQQITENLTTRSSAQVPSTSFIPHNLSVLLNQRFNESVSETGEIVVTLQASLFNVLFNTSELEQYLIANSVVGVSQGEVYIANIADLNISYIDQSAQTVNLESLETLGFTIDDSLAIVWNINQDLLKFELVGQKKKDFQTIISSIQGVESASVMVQPVWRGRLPDNNEDIELINTIQQAL